MPIRKVSRVVTVAAGLLLAAALGGTERREEPRPRPELAASPASDPAPAHCCFTNPRYVGTCDVVPGTQETCASILEYLNNPQSQGKAYCGNTSVRGDWTAVACETKTTGD